jgi:hypothetical protein
MTEEFRKEDFESMQFNPFRDEGKSMVEMYPRLRRVRAFRGKHPRIDLDVLLKFVVLYIDPQSPVYDITDLEERAGKVVKILGIKERHAVYNEINHHLLPPDQQGDWGFIFDNFVFEYFRIVNNHEYEYWFTMKSDYHQQCQFLRSAPPSDPETAALDATRRQKVADGLEDKKNKLLVTEERLFRDPRVRRIIENYSTKDDDIAGYAERFAIDNDFFDKAGYKEMWKDEE